MSALSHLCIYFTFSNKTLNHPEGALCSFSSFFFLHRPGVLITPSSSRKEATLPSSSPSLSSPLLALYVDALLHLQSTCPRLLHPRPSSSSPPSLRPSSSALSVSPVVPLFVPVQLVLLHIHILTISLSLSLSLSLHFPPVCVPRGGPPPPFPHQ